MENLRCLTSFVVSGKDLKISYLWVYIIVDLNSKIVSLQRKKFPTKFSDAPITPIKIFLQGKLLFFLIVRNHEMIVRCLSFSALSVVSRKELKKIVC